MNESSAHSFIRSQAESIGLEAEGRLLKLGRYGAEPAGGVTRLLYTPAWAEAQRSLALQMQEDGLDVRFDRVGNLYGRLEGDAGSGGVIVTGSHIDTVVGGGIYDGALGVIAGMMALRKLKEQYGKPVRTLEVVSLCEEEGSRFPLTCWGSGRITNTYAQETAFITKDADGVTMHEAMVGAGFGINGAEPARSDIAAFVELHIEQGGRLEHEGLAIGIVDRIVAQKRATVTVSGRSNHAGTTPMHLRRDALHAAIRMIEKLYNRVSLAGEPMVATVGSMKVEPNISNVIPGSVAFTVDMRHPDDAALQGCFNECLTAFETIAAGLQVDLAVNLWMDAKSVAMDESLVDALRRGCERNGVSWRIMASGAGHDAQLFAPHCPAALLFVPSSGGISHSAEEYTSAVQIGTGIERLMELLYELGYRDGIGKEIAP
ncbi:Zn-dependent hydrolase [Paenibacillus sp. sptzw28]|uniref:Zn-dependent hydrolase n=1 Tax=Paenibacillus sp. sptzw28 TaxID=715179 RepID=UPI001C6E47F6|nr:Zn-dependent hydrolase [Paenibacillus sp. sptzw28]QYR19828.1 Zn-dependent hydrolase [Paenibacillus sp. sptzw28]